MEYKCLNCKNKIEGINDDIVLWCSIICKKDFYLKYFQGNSDVRNWEIEASSKFKKSQDKVMKEIKESGLTFSEFIRSLGDFKEDKTELE